MQNTLPINIALVEDNAVNRNTFLQKIQLLQEYSLLFTAVNGADCLEQLKGLPSVRLPKVIFIDLEMPVMNGIETVAVAHLLYPEIYFIVLTVFDDDDKIFEAIKAGASGYLLKHEPEAVFRQAIENVLQYGGAPMSPIIARKALQLLSQAPAHAAREQANALPAAITHREKEILELLIKGWDAKRIASVLNLSTLTVRTHTANIYEKLHVNSKAQVISLAHLQNWFKE